ncbi:MAG: chloride channel protein, partial [Clostridia bacterium]|nr:chloride channel protein [Clostridia bacterium]
MENEVKDSLERNAKTEARKFYIHIIVCLKWIALALFIGAILGLIATAFAYSLSYVTDLRVANPWIIVGLPFAGLLIVFLYNRFGSDVKQGTNSVIASINSDEKMHFIMTPLIFVSSIISHMFGASVGREGAALQMGASMGHTLAKALKLSDNDQRILIMSGMSAAFAALFGTPLAAAIFAMEVISVGVMYYAALVPCLVSALTAYNLAKLLGVEYASYKLDVIPEFTPYTVGMTALMGFLFATVAILICVTLALSERALGRKFQNDYVRIAVAGAAVVLLSLIFRDGPYNGLGLEIIGDALTGKVVWYAFILKLIFTAISLSGGYRGGEIVPSLFIGATFGCLIGGLIGMPPAFCAALGMVAVFCGVTNSPISSILIGVEMFGGQGLWFFCLA